ncbi:MAG: nuclear transport factor 2 family protein [Deltaproteobacteria bacterium]|nr:nuclear transport factor 2 family protein [Deltaproteobacteria bacterium]
MPIYTPEEQRNIDVTHRLFDTNAKEDKSLLFTEDAVWWNGLPFVGAPGQTEHKGRAAIHGILTGATGGPSAQKVDRGVDAYNVATIRNEDILILADGDYVVRQHTMHAKTHRGQDYTNVYCFVFRFDASGRIRYLTEHWNTWHAWNVLFNKWKLEPAHPTR